MKFETIQSKYLAALKLNNKLAAEIKKGGGGATGKTATMFINANKDLRKIEKQIRSEFNRGNINLEQYKSLKY
jgi:hypothetical protein